jgi:hypothetical protein
MMFQITSNNRLLTTFVFYVLFPYYFISTNSFLSFFLSFALSIFLSLFCTFALHLLTVLNFVKLSALIYLQNMNDECSTLQL